MDEAWTKNVLNIWEVAAYFMLFENVKKEKEKSLLIKTEVEELRFMEILPKVRALGHNSVSLRILLLRVLCIA